jgi:hypothetical protein
VPHRRRAHVPGYPLPAREGRLSAGRRAYRGIRGRSGADREASLRILVLRGRNDDEQSRLISRHSSNQTPGSATADRQHRRVAERRKRCSSGVFAKPLTTRLGKSSSAMDYGSAEHSTLGPSRWRKHLRAVTHPRHIVWRGPSTAVWSRTTRSIPLQVHVR